MIGWSLMAVGIGFTVVQGGLIRFFIQRWGPARTAVFGLVCNVIAFAGFAFAREPWMIYMWIPVSALGAVGGPAVNALMSARVAANSQGALQVKGIERSPTGHEPFRNTRRSKWRGGKAGWLMLQARVRARRFICYWWSDPPSFKTDSMCSSPKSTKHRCACHPKWCLMAECEGLACVRLDWPLGDCLLIS